MNRNHIIIKELQAKYNFAVQPEYQASLLDWLEWSKGLKVAGDEIIVEEHLSWTKESVLEEVVNEGKCKGCDARVYYPTRDKRRRYDGTLNVFGLW